MTSEMIENLQFHDGRKTPISKERLVRFDIRSVVDRYYQTQTLDASAVISDLGPVHIDFTNIQDWAKEIPDIDKRSARVFILWADDPETKEVVVLLRGFFILVPFQFGIEQLKEYHFQHDTPCQPMAIISSFRTISDDVEVLVELVERVETEINKHWRETRERLIDTLEKTFLWERYVYSLETVSYIPYLCPSFDRELLAALKQKKFSSTGVLQIMASPTASYNQISIQSHLEEAKGIIKSYQNKPV
ncbi:MAG: hypothetical protein ACXABU_09600 [Candidatus Hodarchaeales archaeon]|jgi:hypothetical protein